MVSSPLAVAVFVAAAALSLGASAILVVRLEWLGLSEALLGLVAATIVLALAGRGSTAAAAP